MCLVYQFMPAPTRTASWQLSIGVSKGLYEAFGVKENSVVFSDLVALGYGLGCAVKPRSREAVRRRRRA